MTATERVRKAQADTAAAYAKLERQLDPLAAKQQALERGMNLVNRQLERGRITGDEHARMLGLLNQRYAQLEPVAAKLTPAIARFTAANDAASRSTGRMGQIVVQAGFQVQDFFVQVASGQSAYIAFAQQAPQLLGAFGPGGALAGAALSIGAVAFQFLGMADSAGKAANQTSALDKAMGPLTRSIDEQASSLRDLIAKYNEAGEAQQVLTRLKLSASLVETTQSLEKQKKAFDDLVQSALSAQEFTTTAGAVPISAASVVKFGRPDFDIQQTPALADDPVIKLGLQLRELMSSGDFVGATDLISKFGKAGEEAGRGLIDTASSITELTRQSTQARTFLSLVEQGLVKTFRAANDSGRAAGDYGDALAALAGERAWIEAAEQGEAALRDLARQQAINAAETKVYQAAWRQAMTDGVVSASELAEITRVVAEAGDLAAKRFDLESARKGAFGIKEITAATRAFKDELEDANRFLAEQAGGLTEAERAYRPFAAQIEKMNDLLSMKGISDKQRVVIQQTINRLELAGAVAMETANDKLERLINLRRQEIDQLDQRNAILSRVAAGGDAARQARVDLERFDVKVRIDSSVERFADSMRDVNGILSDTAKTEVARYKALLLENAALDEQIQISSMARSAVGGAVDTLSAIVGGDWEAAAQGIDNFMSDFRDLEIQTGSAAGAFDALADSVLNSADAGRAFGDIIGKMFGRSEGQQKNAKIGETVAGTIGDALGVPKGLSRFVGNIVGGLFGPGKSDATAGVQVYTRDDRIQNFDTSASKQDAGNMSARDALAQSVMQYTNLLETIGGKLSSIVAIEVGSRDGNRWRVTDPNGKIVQSGVTAVGDIEGTLSQVLAAITDTLTGVPDALKARLQQVDFSELPRAESDVNHVLNYDMAIAKMKGTLEGGAEAVENARKQVRDLRAEVEDFGATSARLGFDTAITTDALRTQVERFAGIGAAVPEMTAVEVQVAALHAAFADLAPVLELVGYGATDAAYAVTQAEAARMASLRADVSGRQDRTYNSLIGNSYLNDIRDLITQRDTDIRDALAVGLTDAGAQRNFSAALAGVLTTDLRADQLQEAIRLFGDVPAVVTAANAALAGLNSGIEGVAQAARSAADIANEREGLERQLLELQGNTVEIRARERAALDESNRTIYDNVIALRDQKDAAAEASRALDEAAQAMDRLRSQGGSIRGWIDQARGGGIEGYLSPQQQLANASADFYKQLDLAAANDNDALASITSYADRYVKAQQAVAGSGGQTQSIIAGVLGSLEALPAVKSFDQQQLDLLTEIAANTDTAAKRLLAADLDGDTRITWPEFTSWAADNLGDTRRIAQILGVQSNSLEDIFKAIDVNGDGVIDAVERSRLGVAEAVYSLPTKTATQIGIALSPYFNTLDHNLDGLLTPEEFRGGLVGLASDANITNWFKELDANGDGVLSATELTRRAVIDLGSGGGEGTLLAIGRLIYAGNVDRLNLVNATNLGLITLGALIDAGNSYLMAIRDKSWSVTVSGSGGGAAESYSGGYDAARDASYLSRYPDVAAAMGNYASAYEHYMAHGRFEGRSYDTGTDGHIGGPALVHGRELLLPNLDRGSKVLTARETAEMFRPININLPTPPAASGWREMAQAIRQLEAGQREQTAAVKRLEAGQLRIAQAQAGQQAAEAQDQVAATNNVAAAVRERRRSIG